MSVCVRVCVCVFLRLRLRLCVCVCTSASICVVAFGTDHGNAVHGCQDNGGALLCIQRVGVVLESLGNDAFLAQQRW